MTLLSETSPHLERRAALLEKVQSEARSLPGIYRFVGLRGELLYVGKSVRLRARLLSYFRAGPGEMAGELVRSSSAVEWEYVPTEFEALLREFRLIRTFRPRFNVQHRRERRFAWVKLTAGPAPRLVATRVAGPGGLLFGPFPARRDVPAALHRLAQVMKLRDCPADTPMFFSDQIDLLDQPRAPACSRADLGTCLAPCAARCAADDYAARVRETVAFLRGSSDTPLQRLLAQMEDAAGRQAYEMAARLRDSEERLRKLRDDVVAFREYLDGLTFVYRVPLKDGLVRGYLLRAGRVRLTFDEPTAGSDAALEVATRIRAVLAEKNTPPAVLTPEEREELFLVARWFRAHPSERFLGEEPEEFLTERLASPPGIVEDGAPADPSSVTRRRRRRKARS
jgi:excinuclease ABC subunit C